MEAKWEKLLEDIEVASKRKGLILKNRVFIAHVSWGGWTEKIPEKEIPLDLQCYVCALTCCYIQKTNPDKKELRSLEEDISYQTLYSFCAKEYEMDKWQTMGFIHGFDQFDLKDSINESKHESYLTGVEYGKKVFEKYFGDKNG